MDKIDKLSDKIVFSPECSKLIDLLVGKMKQDVYETAKKICYEKDQATVDKSTLLNILHNYCKRLDDFIDPDV